MDKETHLFIIHLFENNYLSLSKNTYLSTLPLPTHYKLYTDHHSFFNGLKIVHIIPYHSHSKCIFVQKQNSDHLYLYSISNSHYPTSTFIFNNLNRINFLPKNLNFINKNKDFIPIGLYNELFEQQFFQKYKDFITNKQFTSITFVGVSLNSLNSIFLAYLTTYFFHCDYIVFGYCVPSFCNKEFIQELESKLKINIVNIHQDLILKLPIWFSHSFSSIEKIPRQHLSFLHNHQYKFILQYYMKKLVI